MSVFRRRIGSASSRDSDGILQHLCQGEGRDAQPAGEEILYIKGRAASASVPPGFVSCHTLLANTGIAPSTTKTAARALAQRLWAASSNIESKNTKRPATREPRRIHGEVVYLTDDGLLDVFLEKSEAIVRKKRSTRLDMPRFEQALDSWLQYKRQKATAVLASKQSEFESIARHLSQETGVAYPKVCQRLRAMLVIARGELTLLQSPKAYQNHPQFLGLLQQEEKALHRLENRILLRTVNRSVADTHQLQQMLSERLRLQAPEVTQKPEQITPLVMAATARLHVLRLQSPPGKPLHQQAVDAVLSHIGLQPLTTREMAKPDLSAAPAAVFAPVPETVREAPSAPGPAPAA